jgi:tellurite resistance protein TehA-like permease
VKPDTFAAVMATGIVSIAALDLKIVFLAVLFWAAAIVVYLVMTGLFLARAVRDSSAPDLAHPDVWILMGGAAIATLAVDISTRRGCRAFAR